MGGSTNENRLWLRVNIQLRIRHQSEDTAELVWWVHILQAQLIEEGLLYLYPYIKGILPEVSHILVTTFILDDCILNWLFSTIQPRALLRHPILVLFSLISTMEHFLLLEHNSGRGERKGREINGRKKRGYPRSYSSTHPNDLYFWYYWVWVSLLPLNSKNFDPLLC